MTITGTRPELIKLSRLMVELEKHVDHVLVHTGQNYDYELNQIFFDDLGIREPDYFLEVAGSSSAETIGKVIIASDKILEESKEALEYLRSQLAENSLVQLRESINNLIESQLEIQMMANINEDYILVEIDPPFVPEKAVSNSKMLIVIFSTILGSLFGATVVLTREYLKRTKVLDTQESEI